jgi:hypothetical protein
MMAKILRIAPTSRPFGLSDPALTDPIVDPCSMEVMAINTTSIHRLNGRDELHAAAAHLDHLGIAHGPIKGIGISHILEFGDPDNIALELIAASSTSSSRSPTAVTWLDPQRVAPDLRRHTHHCRRIRKPA